ALIPEANAVPGACKDKKRVPDFSLVNYPIMGGKLPEAARAAKPLPFRTFFGGATTNKKSFVVNWPSAGRALAAFLF
ncbi:MAG: hypothetical protein ACK5JD_05830, partial [Mangrovibacterium sp.]